MIFLNQILIVPTEDSRDAFEATEHLARLVLQKLPETPLQAVGINLTFDVDKELETSIRRVFEIPDVPDLNKAGAAIKTTTVSRTLMFKSRTINLIIQCDEGSATLSFNHHSDIPDAKSADALLDGAVSRAWEDSRELASAVYGATLPGGV